jgi:ribosomal protein S18 acetylase RimI-like enzyme
LRDVDDEFVPPLSSRGDSIGLRGSGDGGVLRYLEAIVREEWLLALSGDRLVGLLSYVAPWSDRRIPDCSPAMYVTTLAVATSARRTGVAGRLYDCLGTMVSGAGARSIATRTWSTNDSHIALLRARGFREVLRVPDERMRGVDSVYFARGVPVEVGPCPEFKGEVMTEGRRGAEVRQ